MVTWEERYHLGLMEFDLLTQFHRDQRANLLVKTVIESETGDENHFEALLCRSGLPNAKDITEGNIQICPHQCLNIPVHVYCQAEQRALLYSCASETIVISMAFVSCIEPLIFHLDENSTIYPNRSAKKHSIMSIEFCAGGYGGWAMATRFLKRVHQIPILRTIAIDYDQKAIQNWLLTYGGHYIETQSTIPWQLVELFDGNLGIAADIHDHHWKQMAATSHPSVATISAPCVSWSGANSQKGLFSEGGLVLMATIMQCKFLRPRIILLEQVKNFEAHSHYQKAMQLLTAAGYRIIFKKIIDAGDGCPMSRPRWLAIACDALSKHDFDLATFCPQWLGDLNLHPASFGCMLPLSSEEKDLMILSQSIMTKYFQQNLAPSCMKNNLAAKRSTRATQKMPTLMASYGKQHTFSDQELQKHGLYGHFLIETDVNRPQLTQLRLWHPHELAIMFSPVFSLVLMKDHETAWRHLGNAITTNHACFLVVASLPLLLIDPPKLTTQDALLSLLEHRLQKDKIVVQQNPKCWILTVAEEQDMHKTRVEAFLAVISQEVGAIPHATFFHEQKGVLTFANVRAIWNCSNTMPEKSSNIAHTEPLDEAANQHRTR